MQITLFLTTAETQNRLVDGHFRSATPTRCLWQSRWPVASYRTSWCCYFSSGGTLQAVVELRQRSVKRKKVNKVWAEILLQVFYALRLHVTMTSWIWQSHYRGDPNTTHSVNRFYKSRQLPAQGSGICSGLNTGPLTKWWSKYHTKFCSVFRCHSVHGALGNQTCFDHSNTGSLQRSLVVQKTS